MAINSLFLDVLQTVKPSLATMGVETILLDGFKS